MKYFTIAALGLVCSLNAASAFAKTQTAVGQSSIEQQAAARFKADHQGACASAQNSINSMHVSEEGVDGSGAGYQLVQISCTGYVHRSLSAFYMFMDATKQLQAMSFSTSDTRASLLIPDAKIDVSARKIVSGAGTYVIIDGMSERLK